MININFHCMHSASSPHVIIDIAAQKEKLKGIDESTIAQLIADSTGPIGADGVVVVDESDEDGLFPVRAYTPNGNQPSLCINALMCVNRYIREFYSVEEPRVSVNGRHYQLGESGKILNLLSAYCFSSAPVRFGFDAIKTDEQKVREAFDAVLPGEMYRGALTAADILTPQIFYFPDAIFEDDLERVGHSLNLDSEVFGEGINANFIKVLDHDSIFVRTFERGGAGMSLSCASASMASLAEAWRRNLITYSRQKNFTVFTKGGVFTVSGQRAKSGFEMSICSNSTFIYHASTTMNGSRLENFLKGEIYLNEITAFAELMESAKSYWDGAIT